MKFSTTLNAFSILFFALCVSAQVNTGSSEAERKAKIVTSLQNNSFIKDPVKGPETVRKMLDLQNKIIAKGGCKPNLCFGLDNSRQITPDDYVRQEDFMTVVAGTVGAALGFEEKVHFAAYQYGAGLKTISQLTQSTELFFQRVKASSYSPSSFTFLAPAILHCSRQMKKRFTNDANKIVLIGDGRTRFRLPRVSINEAKKFLPPKNNGAICAITVANPDISFLSKVTQNKKRVLNVKNTEEFIDLLEIVVKDVCNIV